MIPFVNHIISMTEKALPLYRSGNHKAYRSFIAIFKFLVLSVTAPGARRGYGVRAIEEGRRVSEKGREGS